MITTLHGDCREVLRTLPDASVQCCVTSPPYYGLRKYSDDPREIGQEATPALYVAALVDVFREVRRVLRNDGVLWLNLGDSYAGNGVARTAPLGASSQRVGRNNDGAQHIVGGVEGVKEKNLLGIPWRVAFALQDDGWYLRSDIIWHKPNCMPESVVDRPTRSHEYVFLLSKSARYFYDADAIREENTPDMQRRAAAGHTRGAQGKLDASRQDQTSLRGEHAKTIETNGRNRRTVWTIPTQPYSGAHYATMPEALIAPCILAGSAAQACEVCGAPWVRVVERESAPPEVFTNHNAPVDGMTHAGSSVNGEMRGHGQKLQDWRNAHPAITTGFAPTCTCPDANGSAASTVLDPFAGSGTVPRVAIKLGREAIGIELNQEYIDEHIEKRTTDVQVSMVGLF